MADGKELKVKSFRIDDETADKFKEIENISEEEVQSDMYCTFIPLEMN